MKAPIFTLILSCFVCPTFAQTAAPDTDPQQQSTATTDQQTKPPDQPTQPPEAQRIVLEVKPGEQAIKNKDLWDRTGYFHPFLRMPEFILRDQGLIWASPFHTRKQDTKWWVIFGTATGVLIATDKWTEKQLPNTNAQVRLGNYASNIGAAYTLIPIAAGFYFLGTAKGSDHFREAGMLSFETLIDTTLVETIIKSATDRARPLESNGKGRFWDSSGPPWNASFPSGHAINTFGLASIFAHEYPHTWWVKVLAYGYAGTVVATRLAARKHFPGDVVVGGAMGWFIGDYVCAKRHNPELDQKRSATQKVLAHVRNRDGI
jgi:membrane-associated phospholipid phosphatase